MSDWTEGYVDEVGYVYGNYPELNPLRTRLALLNAGFAAPEATVACELGFGQGVSVNLHAAGSAVEWWGTDFNPAHATFARSLAEASGARLFDDAFADFCRRPELPDFDFIALHGVWSWISAENQAVVVDFIRRKLKVGGVLHLSYNALPGWASVAPLRRLLSTHNQIMGAPGAGIVKGVDDALGFIEALVATNPSFVRGQPHIAEFLGKMKGQPRPYLAHEYLNRDWRPMYFSEVSELLRPAKMTFACSAAYMDHLNVVNFTPQQSKFLDAIADTVLKEEVRDFIVNQQFRRDYWIKGGRRVRGEEQLDGLRRQEVVLTAHRPDVALKAKAHGGEFTMAEAIYAPVLDLLADHKARSLGDIEQALHSKGLNIAQVTQVVLVLIAAGHVAPAYPEAERASARRTSEALNKALIEAARFSDDVTFLASPVIGGGLAFPRISKLFLGAIRDGRQTPGDRARYVWDILKSQGQGILKDGAPLSEPDNIAELASRAETFSLRGLPYAKALEVA